MAKFHPDKCVHRDLHPGRFDGSHAVCLDCEHVVTIITLSYMNGQTPREQLESALAHVEADVDAETTKRLQAHQWKGPGHCLKCNKPVTEHRVYSGVVGPFCNTTCRDGYVLGKPQP